MLELEQIRYIPFLKVEAATFGPSHIQVENLSEAPAYNVKIKSNKREKYVELGDVKPSKRVVARFARDPGGTKDAQLQSLGGLVLSTQSICWC